LNLHSQPFYNSKNPIQVRWVLEQQFLSRNANHNIDGKRLVDPYHTINRIRTLEKQRERPRRLARSADQNPKRDFHLNGQLSWFGLKVYARVNGVARV